MVLHVEDVGRLASFGGVLNDLLGQGSRHSLDAVQLGAGDTRGGVVHGVYLFSPDILLPVRGRQLDSAAKATAEPSIGTATVREDVAVWHAFELG